MGGHGVPVGEVPDVVDDGPEKQWPPYFVHLLGALVFCGAFGNTLVRAKRRKRDLEGWRALAPGVATWLRGCYVHVLLRCLQFVATSSFVGQDFLARVELGPTAVPFTCEGLHIAELCPGASTPPGSNATVVIACACKTAQASLNNFNTVSTVAGGLLALFLLPLFARLSDSRGRQALFKVGSLINPLPSILLCANILFGTSWYFYNWSKLLAANSPSNVVQSAAILDAVPSSKKSSFFGILGGSVALIGVFGTRGLGDARLPAEPDSRRHRFASFRLASFFSLASSRFLFLSPGMRLV